MADEVQAPPSLLTPEYKKTRPGAMLAFAVGTMSDSMEGGLINTLFPVISKALGLDIGALGTLSSISKWARMLFGTMWAIAGDKFGRKKLLVWMTGVWGLWTAAAGFAQNFTQLLILYTIGASAPWPRNRSRTASWWTCSTRMSAARRTALSAPSAWPPASS